MEESGSIRRGYFVRGHGGTQFALPGADERLRAVREPDDNAEAVVLAATDPASPWSAILPWAGRSDLTPGRPQRVAGARVVLWKGRLIAWVARAEPAVLTFLPDGPERQPAARAMARALVLLARRLRMPVFLVATIDGEPAASTESGCALLEAGFVASGGGVMPRRKLGER